MLSMLSTLPILLTLFIQFIRSQYAGKELLPPPYAGRAGVGARHHVVHLVHPVALRWKGTTPAPRRRGEVVMGG